MNSSKRKFSFYRFAGLLGICLAVIVGYAVAGGMVSRLFVWPAFLIIVGVTSFALLALHGLEFLHFCVDIFYESHPNAQYVAMAIQGRRFARGATVIAFLMGLVMILGNIDGRIKEVIWYFSSNLIGLLFGVTLSEVFFPFLEKIFHSKEGSQPVTKKSIVFFSFLVGIPSALLLVIACFVLWDSRFERTEIPHFPPTGHAVVEKDSSPLLPLSEIKLPENPSEKEVRKYILDICRASRNLSSWSSGDAQVGMLAKVGPENLHLLIEQMYGEGNFHVGYAVQYLANESHKDLILKNLSACHDLIQIVVNFGWEEDARKTLVQEFSVRRDYFPIQWIRAVVSLKDPSTYPLLKRYFVEQPNRGEVYEAIRDLQGIDLKEDVEKAWRRAKSSGGTFDKRDMAGIAAEWGIEDGLPVLFQMFEDNFLEDWERRQIQKYIVGLTGQSGTREEVIKWYKENKNKLKFNPATKKYEVKDSR